MGCKMKVSRSSFPMHMRNRTSSSRPVCVTSRRPEKGLCRSDYPYQFILRLLIKTSMVACLPQAGLPCRQAGDFMKRSGIKLYREAEGQANRGNLLVVSESNKSTFPWLSLSRDFRGRIRWLRHKRRQKGLKTQVFGSGQDFFNEQ